MTPSKPVNRLVEMQVEEVSLVDRAANKQRFLLVKRDTTMSEQQTPETNTPPAEGTPVVETPAGQAPAVEAGKAEGDMGGGGMGGGDAMADEGAAEPQGDGNDTMGAAVGALEILTQIVEALGDPEKGPEAAQQLAGLATSLAEIAQAIMDQAGGAPAAEPPPA